MHVSVSTPMDSAIRTAPERDRWDAETAELLISQARAALAAGQIMAAIAVMERAYSGVVPACAMTRQQAAQR